LTAAIWRDALIITRRVRYSRWGDALDEQARFHLARGGGLWRFGGLALEAPVEREHELVRLRDLVLVAPQACSTTARSRR
jgi:hypothetical protein